MSADGARNRETYFRDAAPSGREDGILKGTLALFVGLAAVLVFAPVARADISRGIDPYRGAVAALAEHVDMKPSDDGHDDREGDHDGDHADDHDHDGNDTDQGENGTGDSDDDHESGDNDTAGDGPSSGDNPGSGSDNGTQPGLPPQGPSTLAAAPTPPWIWVLLVAIVGGAAATAYVLRRRRAKTR